MCQESLHKKLINKTNDWLSFVFPLFLPGYCGADIKALCTEAALMALRRRYPQIYGSSVKLKLDVASIVLGPGDFSKAMRTIVPASQRALAPPGRALSPTLRPLLAASFTLVLKALLRVFPHAQCTDRDNTHGRHLEPRHLRFHFCRVFSLFVAAGFF